MTTKIFIFRAFRIKYIFISKKIYSAMMGSMWFYSPINCRMLHDVERFEKGPEKSNLNLINGLFPSWNFRYVTNSMSGKSLNEIKGTCNIASAYYFDSSTQSWDKIVFNEPLTQNKGFVIKVSEECQWELTDSMVPPGLPN